MTIKKSPKHRPVKEKIIEQVKEDSPDAEGISSSEDDFNDISEVGKGIDEAVLHVLDRWYQSYLKIVTFIGTASGIVLLYVGVNLIQLINDVEKGKPDNSQVKIESISKDIQPTFDSLPVLNQKPIIDSTLEKDNSTIFVTLQKNQEFIKIGIIFLTLSLLSTIVCVITTYNWYVTGLSNILRDVKNEDYLFKLLEDKLNYRGFMGKMRFWGKISLISGWIAGVSLGIGVFTYGFGIWEIILDLLF
ncbi:MAG: hypothetical protein AAB316_23885 [Bacteroidota bacterium]